MRVLTILVMLNLLAACGTKTPLTLPPRVATPAKSAAMSPAPTFAAEDNNNKAAGATQ